MITSMGHTTRYPESSTAWLSLSWRQELRVKSRRLESQARRFYRRDTGRIALGLAQAIPVERK